MSEPRKVYKLAERRRQRAEALGGQAYPIEGLDGEIVEIPYMSFWGEELSKKVYDGDYPGDMEVLRLAIRGTWPDEPQRMEAFERLGLQTGDVIEIIGEVLRVKPGAENTPDGAADDDAGAAAGAGKSPSSSGQ